MFSEQINRLVRYAGLGRCIEHYAGEEFFAEHVITLVFSQPLAYPFVCDAGDWQVAEHSCQL